VYELCVIDNFNQIILTLTGIASIKNISANKNAKINVL